MSVGFRDDSSLFFDTGGSGNGQSVALAQQNQILGVYDLSDEPRRIAVAVFLTFRHDICHPIGSVLSLTDHILRKPAKAMPNDRDPRQAACRIVIHIGRLPSGWVAMRSSWPDPCSIR